MRRNGEDKINGSRTTARVDSIRCPENIQTDVMAVLAGGKWQSNTLTL